MDSTNELNFDDIINDECVTVIDFSAKWCMPCRMLKPILERVAEVETDVNLYNLDIDENEEIAKRYRVFSVPTLVAFKSGHKLDTLVGLNSLEQIVEFIENCKKIEIDN